MKEVLSSLPKYRFGWDGAFAMIAGSFIPMLIISSFNVFAMFVLKKNFQYGDFFLLLSNAVMWVGAIWAFDYFICRKQTGKKLRFNFSRTNFYTYLLIFPMMFGMMLIAEFISTKIPVTGPFFGDMYEFFSKLMEQLSNDTSVMIILAVIMAPIFEEIAFRGIIQKGLINKGWKPTNAIIFSSLIFGLVHGNPWQFVGAVLLGGVLGIVYERTKSLLLPMLLHAFNNLCGTLLMHFHKTESFGETLHISEYLILGVGIAIFGIFYFLFMKKYRVHYSEN